MFYVDVRTLRAQVATEFRNQLDCFKQASFTTVYETIFFNSNKFKITVSPEASKSRTHLSERKYRKMWTDYKCSNGRPFNLKSKGSK
uniref:Uncharacterized protein n=1 Tax=Kangiella spongicola TaxID=796379 RepID=A0A318D391_9GAMM